MVEHGSVKNFMRVSGAIDAHVKGIAEKVELSWQNWLYETDKESREYFIKALYRLEEKLSDAHCMAGDMSRTIYNMSQGGEK